MKNVSFWCLKDYIKLKRIILNRETDHFQAEKVNFFFHLVNKRKDHSRQIIILVKGMSTRDTFPKGKTWRISTKFF